MSTNATTGFASAGYTAGQLNAIIKLLKEQAGEDGPNRFLRGEVTVSEPACSWKEESGVIYFSVTSDGTTGKHWIEHLECKGIPVSDYAREVLNSPDFKPTSCVTTKVAVLKGMILPDRDRTTKKIRAEADKRHFIKPSAEVACLICKKFSREELLTMGLYCITTMHEPIKDLDGDPGLLSARQNDRGVWLGAYHGDPKRGEWNRNSGFAFAVVA